MSEESKLVEEVVENTTETKESSDKFNPLAFAGDDTYNTKEEEKTEEQEEVVAESKEDTETTETTEETEEDGWSWDSKTEEKKETEEEYDWDGTSDNKTEETPTAEEALNWSRVGKELGIEITSKDEFVNAINSLQQAAQQQAPANDQVTELRSYLNFSDRDLVAEELKADGIEDSEIEESLDKLEDSGMMKMKAKSIRRVINNAIDQQTTQAKQQAEQNTKQRKEQAENAKKELKNQIKNMKLMTVRLL